jgi:hypothetical protein
MATSGAEPSEQMTDVTFEELIELENEHSAVDTEICAQYCCSPEHYVEVANV